MNRGRTREPHAFILPNRQTVQEGQTDNIHRKSQKEPILRIATGNDQCETDQVTRTLSTMGHRRSFIRDSAIPPGICLRPFHDRVPLAELVADPVEPVFRREAVGAELFEPVLLLARYKARCGPSLLA